MNHTMFFVSIAMASDRCRHYSMHAIRVHPVLHGREAAPIQRELLLLGPARRLELSSL